MPENNLKSGTCPKCGAMEVYTDSDKARHNERAYMMVSPATGFTIDTYVCIACGHFEEYFKDSDLKEAKTMSKLKEKWKKI
jgi:predicted RNA-binding Zn-ribbon protein involved in translation (DUF1610 family)